MIVFWAVFLFLFGLAIGSFLNVVVYRLNHDKSPLKGRSFCPRCRHQLAWKDNLPLLSFIFLNGRCRYCRSPISWQYPLVELSAGILTIGLFFWGINSGRGIWEIIYWLVVSYGLLAIFVSDLRYQTIPDETTLALTGVILIWIFWFRLFDHLLAGLAAGLLFFALHQATGGKGMAFGDVKLAVLLGLFLGWPQIVIGLYWAFITGALLGLVMILLGKKKFGQPIPFGPFLVSGVWVSLIWGDKILNSYLNNIF